MGGGYSSTSCWNFVSAESFLTEDLSREVIPSCHACQMGHRASI